MAFYLVDLLQSISRNKTKVIQILNYLNNVEGKAPLKWKNLAKLILQQPKSIFQLHIS